MLQEGSDIQVNLLKDVKKLGDVNMGSFENDDVIETYLKIRELIIKTSTKLVEETSTQFKETRLAAYKSTNQVEYVKAFREESRLKTRCTNEVTDKVLELLSIDKNQWMASVAKLATNKELMKVVRAKEADVRLSLIKTEIIEDQEKIVQALKARIQQDFKIMQKLE